MLVVMRARIAVLAAGVALSGVLSFGAGQLEAAPIRVCPSSDSGVLRTQLPGARDELVAPGTTGVLLCRYRGLDPYARRFRLIASGRVRKAVTVRELRTQFNALPQSAPGPTACPADFDSMIVAYFRYARGPDAVVTVDTTGCEGVSNGRVHRTAALGPGPVLVRELEALTR